MRYHFLARNLYKENEFRSFWFDELNEIVIFDSCWNSLFNSILIQFENMMWNDGTIKWIMDFSSIYFIIIPINLFLHKYLFSKIKNVFYNMYLLLVAGNCLLRPVTSLVISPAGSPAMGIFSGRPEHTRWTIFHCHQPSSRSNRVVCMVPAIYSLYIHRRVFSRPVTLGFSSTRWFYSPSWNKHPATFVRTRRSWFKKFNAKCLFFLPNPVTGDHKWPRFWKIDSKI